MKNDVVRWSATPNTANHNNNNNNNNNNSSSNSNNCSYNNNNNTNCNERNKRRNQNDKVDSGIANGSAVAVAVAVSSECTTANACVTPAAPLAIKCDTNANFIKATATNSFLVHTQFKRNNNNNNNNNSVSGLSAVHYVALPSRHCFQELKQQQQQQQQQTKHNHETQQQQQKRTFYATFRIILYCLQICGLVLLCTWNVGFVSGATTIGAASTSLTSNGGNSIDTELPQQRYELDYELGVSGSGSDSESNGGHFTHTWAVHIPNGEKGVADQVARDHGFVNLGKIFDDHYHFAHHKVAKRSLLPAESHQTHLDDDVRVHSATQQRAKSRRKRDFIRMRPSRTSSRALSQVDIVPLNDPKWAQMWYLNRGGGLDMNVVPAWKEGITGKGIVVTILDDGLESDHPDIEHNYDPKASYDVNSHDDDPMPHYDMTDSNRHGTRCAGEVAATANNSICAVGIAFGASVGGVRMLDGDVTDAVEARSLSLNPQHIDIYSASWGPDDDGKTVDGPGELASRAFIEGVTKGRNGKGSIFIWASGNGGRELDNCNCDGYTNSIWTLSISSATEEGHVPWYSEKCSSTLATTYSSGGQNEKQVVTTDLHHSCTVSHTGTSASAPLAAGIAALVLESNQNLTWRDLQHIVVRTAKPANLKDPTWSKNGVGRRISHSFGYGLMDAAAMVKVARNWKTVPEQQRCEINAPHVDKVIPPRSYITLQLTVKHCLSVNYLEHVQAKITLTSQRRGDIQLYLKSPAGTKVTLLTSRIHDVSRSGFNQWPFMSVHTWGESPHGNWQLEIHNEGRYMAQITQWDLIFYGTERPAQPEDPVHISAGLFGNDMEHNDIEYDANGQWRNMQQVGESRVMANDKTNTSCLKSTPDQRCLECAAPTYLFNGRCLVECPMHTYAVVPPTKLNSSSDNNYNNNNNNNNNNNSPATYLTDNKISKSNEEEEELQSMDRKRRSPLLQATENDLDMQENAKTPRHCNMCDASCLRCYGPLNSQCSTCIPGSQLRKMPQSNETFCYAFAERSSGNSHESEAQMISGSAAGSGIRANAALLLILMVPLLLTATVVVVIAMTRRSSWQLPCWRRNAGYTMNSALHTVGYDRVQLLSDDIEGDADEEEYLTEAVCVYRDEADIHVDGAAGGTNEMHTPIVIEAVHEQTSESEEEEDLFNNFTLRGKN